MMSADKSKEYFIVKRGEFKTGGVRFVEHMSFLEALSFVGEGVGAALYILGASFDSLIAMVLGIAFVGAAVIALVAHLGRPHLAWRAVTRIRASWVSRGTLFIGLFTAFSISAVAAGFVPILGALQGSLTVLALICAVLVIIYAGMMLRSMKAVTLWHTLHLPATFSCHSVATALVIFVALAETVGAGQSGGYLLIQAAVAFLLLSFLMSLIYFLQIKRSIAVQASLDRLLNGALRSQLLGGALFVGILVPLCAILLLWFFGDDLGRGAMAMLILAAGSRLYGDYAYRYSIVKAGAYEPVAPPSKRG